MRYQAWPTFAFLLLLPASLSAQTIKSAALPGPGAEGEVLSVVDGTWHSAAVSGAGLGDTSGPASSVDDEVALFSGASGKLIKRASGSGFLLATSGVATFVAPGAGVATWIATPSGANLLSALTTKTGTGVPVFSISPSFTTPNIGVAAGTSLSLSGLAGGGTVCVEVDNNGLLAPAAAACGTGAGGAPTGAKYIVQTADGTLSAEQALSSLSTGFAKVTTATGAITTVVPGTGMETWFATPTVPNFGSVLGSQAAKTFLAAPTGSSGNVSARIIDQADLPTAITEVQITSCPQTLTVWGSAYEVSSSSACTVNLPTVAGHAGETIAFTNIGTGVVTLDGAGSEAIITKWGGSATTLALSQYETANLEVNTAATAVIQRSGDDTPTVTQLSTALGSQSPGLLYATPVGSPGVMALRALDSTDFSTLHITETAITMGVTLTVWGGSYEVNCTCTVVLPTTVGHPGESAAFRVASGTLTLDGSGAQEILDRGGSTTTKTLPVGTSGMFLVDTTGAYVQRVSGERETPAGSTPTWTTVTMAGSLAIDSYNDISCTCTVTLPALSGNTDHWVHYRITGGVVTIDGTSSETIDGSLTRIQIPGEAGDLVALAASWTKVSGKSVPLVAVLTRATDQTFDAATWTATAMTAQASGSALLYDDGNDRITIPRPGVYSITATAEVGDATMTYAFVGIGVSSATPVAGYRMKSWGSMNAYNSVTAVDVVLALSDYVVTSLFMDGTTPTANYATTQIVEHPW